MQSSISLGIEFILPTQRLIKQALCALPLPCGKCLRRSRVLSPWAAHAAEMGILHGDSSRLLFISPRAEVRVPGLRHPLCRFSWSSHDKSGCASSTQSNGKIKGLCPALPGSENCISALVPNEAKPCLLLMSKPSDHPGIKGVEAILPQQCAQCCRHLTSPGRLTLEMSPELFGIITSHCSLPQQQPPKARGMAKFPLPYGEDVPCFQDQRDKAPSLTQFPVADLGQSLN